MQTREETLPLEDAGECGSQREPQREQLGNTTGAKAGRARPQGETLTSSMSPPITERVWKK